MTNAAPIHEQWYEKQWLVLTLCVFVFPVGLYALWRSGKITKGWKVAGTVVIVLGVMGVAGGAWGKSETSKTVSEVEFKTIPVVEKITDEHANKYLFESADTFKAAFNKYSRAHNMDLIIGEMKMSKGAIRNSFQYMFTNNVGLVGSIDKSSGRVIELMMIGSSDGTVTSGANLLLCMGVIIATTNPGLAPAKRKEVFEDLGLFDKTQDLSDMSKKTVRDGIAYYIESNKVTGFIFGASKK